MILVFGCLCAPAQALSNPNASSNTRAVYEYLKMVGRAGATNSLILGQHAGHGSTITRASAHPNKVAATWDSFAFDRYVQPIFDQTGKWPGMLSLDYEFDYPRLFEGYDGNPFTSLREPNRKLKEWWAEGGLVTVNWSPANPWSPGTSGYYGTILPNVNLQDLTNSALAVGKKWQTRLDEIALALGDLQDEGVVVLWRPMQEMDGYWFWPGERNVNGQGEQFRAVWQHLYRYLTFEKGLNNLIWVFSPTYSVPSWLTGATGKGVYPGNDYVDVVAFTVYGSPFGFMNGQAIRNVAGNDALIAYGKPIGVAELGTGTGGATFDNATVIDYVKSTYPSASYVVPWQSFPKTAQLFEYDAWVNNSNLVGAFNHPKAVVRSQIAYAHSAFVPNDPTPWFPDNIALSKPASASHGQATAAAAVDGNLKQGWSTGQQAPANTWLCIDLERNQQISRVKIAWINVENRAKAYRVQVSTNNVAWTDASVQIYRTTGTVDDLNFPAQTSRYVRVFTQAVNGNPYYGYGIQEFEIYAANRALPTRPTGLAAGAVSASQVDLFWQDNSSNESGFKVEQRMGAGAWTVSSNSPANSQTRRITGLKAGNTYGFRLRATNASGDSADSNIATITLVSQP